MTSMPSNERDRTAPLAPERRPVPSSGWTFEWWPRFHDRAYRPSVIEQFAIHWRANLLMLRSPVAVVAFLLLSIWPFGLLLLGIWCIVHLGPGLSAGSPFVGGPVLGPAAFIAAFVGYLLLQHIAFSLALVWTYAPFVRAAIRERGTPMCLHCGQLLHAQGVDRCPECGGLANEPPSIGVRKRRDAAAGSSSARTPV